MFINSLIILNHNLYVFTYDVVQEKRELVKYKIETNGDFQRVKHRVRVVTKYDLIREDSPLDTHHH